MSFTGLEDRVHKRVYRIKAEVPACGLSQPLIKTNTSFEHPEFLLNSVNLFEFTKLTSIRDWDGLADALTAKFAELEKAGVDYAGLCAVTPHVVFERVSDRAGIPLVSMVEETCKAVSSSGASEFVLWGTKLTMTNGFYQKKAAEFGLNVIVPNEAEQAYINDKYFSELMLNDIRDDTKNELIRIANKIQDDGRAGNLVLGGTELSLILSQSDFDGIQVFDSALIHAQAMIDRMRLDPIP